MSEQQPAYEPELIPYGVKVALLCLDPGPWRDSARAYFGSQSYYLMDEPDPAGAAARLRLNAVDVVVAADSKKEALEELHARPGLKRRETTLFVVGPQPSLDSWAAFQTGADWMLSAGDANRGEELISEALKRQEAQREPWVLARE